MAAPAPVVPIGTIVEPATAVADEQFFAPAVLRPVVQLPPEKSPSAPPQARSKAIAAAVVAAFLIAAGATVWLAVRPGATAQHQTPTVLASRAPTAGLPTSLSAIVRIEAESTRHTALETIQATGNANLSSLTSTQPNYTWVAGSKPSTDPKTVSVAQSGSTVTIAVDASSHDVCAFGRWAPDATPVYVTMEHVQTCSAVDAPGAGWSTAPGGAGSDLPDDTG